jgi:hypothetical protein
MREIVRGITAQNGGCHIDRLFVVLRIGSASLSLYYSTSSITDAKSECSYITSCIKSERHGMVAVSSEYIDE